MQTDLAGAGNLSYGEPLNEFIDGVFAGFAAGTEEITYKFSEKLYSATREERRALFDQINPPAK